MCWGLTAEHPTTACFGNKDFRLISSCSALELVGAASAPRQDVVFSTRFLPRGPRRFFFFHHAVLSSLRNERPAIEDAVYPDAALHVAVFPPTLAMLLEAETVRFYRRASFWVLSTGPCFPLCRMSRAPPCFFFTLMARVFSDLGVFQPSARGRAYCVKTLRQKPCDNPSYTTRGLQTSLRGWVVIVGFFSIAILVICRHFAASWATQP